MKIPEKVKIGGLNYAVAVTDNITSGRDVYGERSYRVDRRHTRQGSREKDKQGQTCQHGDRHELAYRNFAGCVSTSR